MTQRKGLSWRAKLSLLLMVFALVPLAVATYLSLRESEHLARRQTLTGLEALARAKAEALEQFAQFRRRDAERMATLLGPFIGELAAAKQVERKVEPPPEQLPTLKDGEDADGVEEDPPHKEPDPPPAVEGEAPPEASTDEAKPPPDAPPPSDEDGEDGEGEDEAASPADEARDALRRALSLIAWDREEFEEILVLDREGRVVVATFEDHEEHSASELRYFEKGLSGTYLEPVFLSPLTGERTMVISTPILDEDRTLLGVLAARLNLKKFFRLLTDTTGLGTTGEAIACRVEGDDVVFLAPTRHRPDAALEKSVPLGDDDARPMQEAARGNSGVGEAVDYRGKDVFAAWEPVRSLDWGVVVKIDVAEAMKPVEEARLVAIVSGIVLVGVGLLFVFFAAGRFVQPLRDLKDATEKISRGDLDVTLDIRSRDEIGELGHSFERMVAAIKFFREHSRPADEEAEEPDEEAAQDGAESPDPTDSSSGPATHETQ